MGAPEYCRGRRLVVLTSFVTRVGIDFWLALPEQCRGSVMLSSHSFVFVSFLFHFQARNAVTVILFVGVGALFHYGFHFDVFRVVVHCVFLNKAK